MQSYDVPQGSAAFPLVFLLVQSSDHISPLTGATPTVTISKNGGAFASPSGAVSEIGSGWYKVAGNATDTNTLGPLLLHATAASGDPCDALYPVVAFNPQAGSNLGLSALPTAAPGAASGLLVAGANAATTIAGLTLSGANASGGNPATAGLTVTGGAASPSLGGLAAPAVLATGGASAASTNVAAAGVACAAGSSNFAGGGNDGARFVASGNGNGVTFAHAGTGLDLGAQTTAALQVGSVASPVTVDGTAAVPPTGNAANSINDCLNAARAQGFGAWSIVGTTLTLFGPDGTTPVRRFTLDSASAPTTRT